MITCEDFKTVESWLSHIQGVTALVELWSSGDWNTTTNVQGFLQVYYMGVGTISTSFNECRSNTPIGDGLPYQKYLCFHICR